MPYHFGKASIRRTDDVTEYETRRPANGPKHLVRYRAGSDLGPSEPGTLQHFFLERYLLFVERRGEIYSGQVHHVPYPAFDATVLHVEDELISAAGLPAPAKPPEFAHFSPGVDVKVFPLAATGVAL